MSAGATFADAAGRMAGQAGILFGWPPDRFWRATPAELAALVAAGEGESETALPPERLAALLERFPDG